MRATFVFALCVAVFGSCSLGFADDRFEAARIAANKGRFKEAKTIWEELSDSGNVEATYNLGRMYARGDGVPRDFGRAREYFEEAANAGHVEATARLGALYLNGDGVRKNQNRAFFYLRKATDGGSTYAKELALKHGIPETVENPDGVANDYPAPPSLPPVAVAVPPEVPSPENAESVEAQVQAPETESVVTPEVANVEPEEQPVGEVAAPVEQELAAVGEPAFPELPGNPDTNPSFDEPPPPPDQIIGSVSDLGAFVARNFSFKGSAAPAAGAK